MSEEEVEKLSHVEHILKRPDSYVDSVIKTKGYHWILDEEDNLFKKVEVESSPALLKIFDEILVNAIDRNSLYPEQVTHINVSVDKESGSITLENNGPLGAICVKPHSKENIYNPELTFGHLLTSTNYNDKAERVVGGRNGYGSKLTNIYSSIFNVFIKDSENQKKYSQTWKNNMGECEKPKILKYSGKDSSVTITFVPDWKRFEMGGMSQDFFKLIERRVYDAAACTSSNCKVTFQNKTIKIQSLEKYAKMFLPESTFATFQSDRWTVCVTLSDTGFQQVSYVNGICTTKGGTHVEHVANTLSHMITEELAKKIKLPTHQIKSSMFIFVKSTLVNPSFSSQAKTECTLKASNFGSQFKPPQEFIKKVLKTGIQEELLSLSKFKEQKELKKTDGSRKSRITGIPKLDDANMAGTSKSHSCTLIVTEGDSAKALAIAGLSIVGRDTYGVFPLRGKCKNVREASVNQLLANQEFNDLKKILGLQQDKKYTSLSELRYGRLMIMTDADHDGSHIKGLIINMIEYFWPSLIELGFVVSMITPIIKASKGSKSESFYTESSFRRWCQTNNTNNWKIKYYKGLGTSTSVEAREYFKVLKNLTVAFELDQESNKSIVLAFDKTKADKRKEWLLINAEKAPEEREIDYGNINSLKVQEFIHRDLVNFSLADLRRSIAHVCDGLKPSQRKVMYACFQKSWKDEMKVAQLAAYVSEKTSYHHGEVSLADTIVKLAHDYVGSNNINFLEPCGQFGTRLMGGKDASQTRYIFTKPCSVTRTIFDPLDEPILNYLDDDGKSIEPEFFVPIIPTVLVNGTEGIGTGFSSYVPPYNPSDIVENIKNILKGNPIKKMKPWFKGFKGQITDELVAKGVYTQNGPGNYHITELPPGKWTQDFKELLDDLTEKKIISSYKNNSTTDNVDFTITGYCGKNIVKDLKLEKQIHTGNMHLFHPNKGIMKYETPEDILVDFLEVRMEYYHKRKENIISQMEKQKVLLNSKALFVQMVIDEDIIIFKVKKAELESQLDHLKFPKIDGNFEYLMNIKTYQYTEEAYKKLMDEAKNVSERLTIIKNTTVNQMFLDDILKL